MKHKLFNIFKQGNLNDKINDLLMKIKYLEDLMQNND